MVSAIVGIDNRSTIDIDATVKDFPLSLIDARKIVEEVLSVQIDDGMSFEILSVDSIMDDSDYSGIRVILNSMIETIVLNKAFHSTSKNRGSFQAINDVHLVFGEIENSPEIKAFWKNYQRKFDFAAGVNWDQVVEATSRLFRIIKQK